MILKNCASQIIPAIWYYKQLESHQLFNLVSTTPSRENITIPSCVNLMSRVNTTCGNATSCLVEIWIPQETLAIDKQNIAWHHACKNEL